MSAKQVTCYIAECDDCGSEHEHDYTPHWPSEGEAIDDAVGSGEWWSEDGVLLCLDCKLKPHGYVADEVVTDCGRCGISQEDHDEAPIPTEVADRSLS